MDCLSVSVRERDQFKHQTERQVEKRTMELEEQEIQQNYKHRKREKRTNLFEAEFLWQRKEERDAMKSCVL